MDTQPVILLTDAPTVEETYISSRERTVAQHTLPLKVCGRVAGAIWTSVASVVRNI